MGVTRPVGFLGGICVVDSSTVGLTSVDTQKIVRCHAADTKRRVLGRDVLRSGPGLGTRHRGRDVPPEVAYSCPHASRKEGAQGRIDPGTMWPCSRGFPRCATESCPEADCLELPLWTAILH